MTAGLSGCVETATLPEVGGCRRRLLPGRGGGPGPHVADGTSRQSRWHDGDVGAWPPGGPWSDEDFADCYPRNGRPGLLPDQLAAVASCLSKLPPMQVSRRGGTRRGCPGGADASCRTDHTHARRTMVSVEPARGIRWCAAHRRPTATPSARGPAARRAEQRNRGADEEPRRVRGPVVGSPLMVAASRRAGAGPVAATRPHGAR